MNAEAWDSLLARMKDSAQRPTAEQLRILAAIHEQLAQEITDVLNITADALELESEAVDEGDTY